ncbi:hypothetical protein Poli38472_008589 [Pythium oligandrum]|uniref:FYVE-type domain-containing protein n=1 Tax=Pythium oligandrum TaxID=41045 RepID=A0A8K1C3P9_PYTOL|nr:hypothetical protein Poli38472_008589 [Pythium oligandrum]|eukprot:TMW55941.1 hypothetical protein Poli38472_008589 [Pythium oligandrum]
MSIFGGSERFPDEPARSPGPVYGRVEIRSKGYVVVMKRDIHPVDESRKWGKRESWIGGSISPQMPVVRKETLAPGQYNTSVEAVKSQAPKVSFPKSSRFLSQKVNMTDRGHERELMAAESPGPKYNVGTLAANGGKAAAPGFSFASPSPETKTRLPSVGTPKRGHRESWLSVINRNGVLVMPSSPPPPPAARTEAGLDDGGAGNNEGPNATGSPSRTSRMYRGGSVFGNEHRFGHRQNKAQSERTGLGGQRIQFVSAKHTRENMGEFSPGPIYAPFNPECPGGRLAPSPRVTRREPPPGSPRENKNPHANLSSRSSWLAGNVRKSDGVETVLMRTGDVPPGPGFYGDPRSSFATITHNAKVKGAMVKPSRPSPRSPPQHAEHPPPRQPTFVSFEMAPVSEKVAAPAAPAAPTNNLGCIKCGRDIAETDAFCIYCGTKVSVSLAQHKQKAQAAKPAAEEAKPKRGEAPKPPSKVEDKKPEASNQEATISRAPSSGKVVSADALKAQQSARGRAPAPPSSASKTEVPPAPKSAPTSSSRPSAPAPAPPAAPASASKERVPEPPKSAPSSTKERVPEAPKSAPTSATPAPAPQAAPARTQSSQSSNSGRPPRQHRSSVDEAYHGGRGSFDAVPSDVAGLEKLWVPDNFSTDCMDCKTSFGFGKRRHHCRVCGLLFCRDCVKNKEQVPQSFGYGSAPQRCCRNCVTALKLKAITSPADVFAQRRGGSKKSISDKESHYEILGVSKDASAEEITRQYNAMARTINHSSKDDMEQLEKITDAYRTLNDPTARSRHDSQVRGSNVSDRDNSFVAETARSDQTECQVCFRPFKLGRRQHHCRRCTRSVCTQCSEGQKAIPELGFPTPVRHCSACMDNPPKFVPLIVEPVSKPPAGFEYLSKLDIHLSVKAISNDEEVFEIKTYCQPNEAAAKAAGASITDQDRLIANEYAITNKRTFADFEWLFTILGDVTNSKALPNFPERRAQRGTRAGMLQTFVYGSMIHPLLRDADCLKAFLALPEDDFNKFKRAGVKNRMYDTDKYNSLVVSLRLELEKAQIRAKVDELVNRQKDNGVRMTGQQARAIAHKDREASQTVRRDQATTRFKALEARKESQTERMAREKDRYEKQANTTHILFFDVVRDEATRNTEEEARQKDKVEFTKSKDAFQTDTVHWNRDMAEWSKHRANWSEAHNPPISKDIANEWIIKSYGVYHPHYPEKLSEVPRDLVELHNKLVKMQEKEPAVLEEEGNIVDDEWMKLAKEREHWTNDRANMKREDEMCADEDKRYAQEHDYVRLAGEARAKKVKAIEADLLALKTEITSRERVIAQRRVRHQALDVEYEKEWRVIQAQRIETTKGRLEEHSARITRGTKRNEIFEDQLARQAKSQRMLLFKRAALTEERTKDRTLFAEHKEDSRNALEEARNKRELTPEYIARIKADMKIRAEEYQRVVESNQRTPFEGGDKEVDERDEFMNDVRRRRAGFQKELDNQKTQLETELKLCESLLKRMEEHMAKLDEEIANAAKEEALIAEFTALIEKELKLLSDEEAKRDEKKAKITELMNNAGNWVLDALHEHSTRKKKEADRLVQQAVRAADLQKLVQHFTHRVIDQEERIMRQKQRILNCEHKVEMLKSSENWFQYVTSHTPDLGKKDHKIMETGKAERVEDLKEASRLQKDDETDMQSVTGELSQSRKFAKEKEEKRAVWAQVEDVYSLQKPQEKDEDMMMTSQIRSLLQQLGEAFEMLANRLLEEDESLQHASTQLVGEVESINAFMQRMESEENALCNTEKASLTKETQVRRSEADLIEQRARALVDSYKQMQAEHAKYPVELDKIKSRRNERERPVTPRDAEFEMAKKLIKSRNYYDRKACAEFAKKFKIDSELKEVRDVFEWLKAAYDSDIKKMERWLEASRKERKQTESVKVKASQMDWEKDTLARIPALKDIQKKLSRSQSSASSDKGKSADSAAIHAAEQWIVELITIKKSIYDIDTAAIKTAVLAGENMTQEEQKVAATLQKIKTDKEYVLNSIRFIDQEEAKAVRATGKGVTRRTESEVNRSSDDETVPLTPMAASSRVARPPVPMSKSASSVASSSSSPGAPSVSRPADAKRPTASRPKPVSAEGIEL